MTAPAIWEQRSEETVDEPFEIFCPCNLWMTLCGKYSGKQSADNLDPSIPDADCCPDCVTMFETHGCPYCGCKEHQSCRRCAE